MYEIKSRRRANTACSGQVRGFARTFGDSAPTADSASGSFSRQIPHLPLTPAVGRLPSKIKSLENIGEHNASKFR